MSKKDRKDRHHGAPSDNGKASVAPSADPPEGTTAISADDYQAQLHLLQVELVKLQRHFISCGDKILVVVEGRDAAGKDGSIKRIVEYLSPRETRVVALGKPSDPLVVRSHDAPGFLSRLHYAGKKPKLVRPDRDIAFELTPDCIQSQRLAR